MAKVLSQVSIYIYNKWIFFFSESKIQTKYDNFSTDSENTTKRNIGSYTIGLYPFGKLDISNIVSIIMILKLAW